MSKVRNSGQSDASASDTSMFSLNFNKSFSLENFCQANKRGLPDSIRKDSRAIARKMTKECEKDQNQITQQIMREKSDTSKYLDEFNEEFLKTFSD